MSPLEPDSVARDFACARRGLQKEGTVAHDLARARAVRERHGTGRRPVGRPVGRVRADNLRLRSEAMELALIVRESVARRHELGDFGRQLGTPVRRRRD